MVMSVNTNAGAMIALQNLSKTNMMLEETQLRVTTGLRVNGPKDNGRDLRDCPEHARRHRRDVGGQNQS